MSSRLTGEIRLRLSGAGAREHIGDARKLLGALKEYLGHHQLKIGQLVRTLPDGTVIRALYDGTLYIAEIATPGAGGPCTTWIPDIIGIASAISDPDEHPLPDTPVPANLPITQHTTILGWVTPRPAPDAVLEALTDTSIVARWASNGLRPPAAEGTPKGIYDYVVDACGASHPVHQALIYGNHDWTDGRDTITCWSGHQYEIYNDSGDVIATAMRAGQRYNVPGVGREIYLRGRVLYTVPAGRVVNGIALRTVDGVKYLMVVWRAINTFDSGLLKIRIRWPASDPYPRDIDAEDIETVVTFQQQNASMWFFNASGTEARRIALSMVSEMVEQVLTDDGVQLLTDDGLRLVDTFATLGSSTVRNAWLAFSEMFYGAPSESSEYAIPLRTLAGSAYSQLYRTYWDYGRTSAATGSGETLEKLAVDYIGDVPEYLMLRTTGGSLTSSDQPTSVLTPIIDVADWTNDNPGPHPCPSVVTNIATYRMEWHKTIASTRTMTQSYTTPSNTFVATTWGDVATTVVSGTRTRNSSSNLRRHETEDIELTEQVTTDVGCFVSAVTTAAYNAGNELYELTESNATAATTTSALSSLLYADLRQGVFVVHRADAVATTTTSRATTLRRNNGYVDAATYQEFTDDQTVTTTTSSGGSETLRVLYRGAEVLSEVTLVPTTSNTSTTTQSDLAALNPDDTFTINRDRLDNVIWQYFAASFLTEIAGAAQPPDADDYPTDVDWYLNSPYAIRSDGAYSPSDSVFLEQPPAYAWYYPIFDDVVSEFWQAVSYQPDSYAVDPEQYTYTQRLPQFTVPFGVAADDQHLFLSMPLPVDGYSADWRVVNVMPEWVYQRTAAPDTYRFYPLSFISPAFNS